MITFNIKTSNDNYYRGHEPSNKYGNCLGDEEDALNFTIEQAREFCKMWRGGNDYGIQITISKKAKPISDDRWRREIFCLNGGYWGDFLEHGLIDARC